jgi:hypothetical protein
MHFSKAASEYAETLFYGTIHNAYETFARVFEFVFRAEWHKN